MILVDEPRWPAHGTVFAHLVSDASYAELLTFAADAGLHPRAFDHDHYDIPLRRHDELVARGAVPVASTELVRRLRASGLRVRNADRTPKRRTVLPRLHAAWDALFESGTTRTSSVTTSWQSAGPDNAVRHEDPGLSGVRDALLARWSAPGRHYHDVRHLARVLDALDALGAGRPERLAAWFHDAIYDGRPDDEARSAALASELLDGRVPSHERDEVVRLVLLTASHDPAPGDARGQRLVDADLSILGTPPGRYLVYARDVRLDHAHVPDAKFTSGRLAVIERLLDAGRLFSTPQGQTLWRDAALTNLVREQNALRSGRYWFELGAEVSS